MIDLAYLSLVPDILGVDLFPAYSGIRRARMCVCAFVCAFVCVASRCSYRSYRITICSSIDAI